MDLKVINSHTGAVLRWLRTVFKLDTNQLADQLGISESDLARLEAGRSRLGHDLSNRLARVLGLDRTQIGKLLISEQSVPPGPIRSKLLTMQQRIREQILSDVQAASERMLKTEMFEELDQRSLRD